MSVLVPMRYAAMAGGALVFAAAVLYRALTAEVVNDDYLHLAVAQQIVLGDVPVRDFIDPGEFLFNYTSALAQILLGHRLGAEVLLDIVVLALGHTLTFVAARRLSGSPWLALLTTALSVLLVTRLYSYPKLFLYPLALLVMWGYADRPVMGRLAAGAACTAVVFLFRHDHGANVGAAMAVTLLLVHWGDWRTLARRGLWFGAMVLALLVPFLLFLQISGGGLSYWRNMLETGDAEYQRTVGPWPRFTGEPWAGNPANGLAWFYYLTILLPPLSLSILAWGWLRGGRVGMARDGVVPARREAANGRAVTIAAALAIAMHVFLLRAASESAVADVSALTAILGAWLLAHGLRGVLRGDRLRPRSLATKGAGTSSTDPGRDLRAGRLLRVLLTLLVFAGTIRFAGHTEGFQAAARVAADLTDDEPGPVFRRFEEFWRMAPPYEDEGARYVFACTAESDRLLVASAYAPHAYYAAGRGFAAGRQYFLSSQGPSPEFHQFSARRLAEERVPIVLVNPPDFPEFSLNFAEIRQYLDRHYREAGVVEFDESPMTVLVDRRIPPAGTWGERNLPCFVSS